MSVASIRNTIEQLKQVKTGALVDKIDELIEVRKWLDENQSTNQLLEEVAQLRGDYKQIVQPLIELLDNRVKERLEKYLNGQFPDNLGQLEAGLKDIQFRLNSIIALVPERKTDSDFAEQETNLRRLLKKAEGKRRLQKLQKDVEKLWQKAEAIEQQAGGPAVSNCREAQLLVEAETSEGWDTKDEIALIHLQTEAKKRYDDMRRRHEIPITKQAGDQLVELVLEFTQRAEENPDEIVTYFKLRSERAFDGEDAEPMPVGEALGIARDNLQQFWKQKITQYIHEAEEKLEANKPQEARNALQAWNMLPGLNDDRIDLALHPDDSLRIEQLEEKIEPVFLAYQEAKKLLDQAEWSSATDPKGAYEKWQKAQEKYGHLSRLEDIKKQIVENADKRLEALLIEANNYLKKEAWSLTKERLNRIQNLIEIDNSLTAKYQDQHLELHRVHEMVDPVISEDIEQSSIEAEINHLEKLEKNYADSYWPSWTRLQDRLIELKGRSSVNNLIEEAEKHYDPNCSLEDIQRLQQDAERMATQLPHGLTSDDEQRLTTVISSLKAWSGFAQARDELEQVDQLRHTEGQEIETTSPPNLKRIAEGIEAAKKDPGARQALKSTNFEFTYQSLTRNDTQSKQDLVRVEELASTADRESWQEILSLTQTWLQKMTSHRLEWLQTKQMAQEKLAQLLKKEINQLINKARHEWYETLDYERMKELRSITGEYLATGKAMDDLLNLMEEPLAMANAHNLQRLGQNGYISWKRVEQAWEEAKDKVIDNEDMYTYCLRQAKQAYKKNKLREVILQEEGSQTAEQILLHLIRDPILQNDWEVWYSRGEYGLKAARHLVHKFQTAEATTEADRLLSMARESFNRSQRITVSEEIIDSRVTKIPNLLHEINQLTRLLEAQHSLLDKIQISDRFLTANNCREVRKTYEEGRDNLKQYKTLEPLFEKFWNNQVQELRKQLEEQLNRLDTSVNRVDVQIALHILLPGDPEIEGELLGLIQSELHTIKNEIYELVDDRSASRFRERIGHENRDYSEKDIAKLQLNEVNRMLETARNTQILLEKLDRLDLSGSLDQEIRQLEDWSKQLRELINIQEQIRTLGQDGLSRPEQFDVADYILRQGRGLNPGNQKQIPQVFQDQAHPTSRWCSNFIQTQKARRDRQVEYKNQIEWCLKYEKVTNPENFPQSIRDSVEAKFVEEELKPKLESMYVQQYPLEVALSLLEDMETHDVNDDCGLQEELSYRDPDNANQLYRSAPVIKEVIKRKVKQIHILRQWLLRYTSQGSLAPTFYPGTVDWLSHKEKIEEKRDSGPEGLQEANKLCQRLISGDEEGTYKGLWSLERTYQALSREKMDSHLRQEMGLNPEDPLLLNPIAREIDKKREKFQQEWIRQLEECKTLRKDIEYRLKHFQEYWNNFRDAYLNLRGPFLFRRLSQSSEWQNFMEAYRVFCQICPQYPYFQEILEEVKQKYSVDLDIC